MKPSIKIIGPHDPKNTLALNVTSRSNDWGRAFSPFLLGPVELWTGEYALRPFIAKNVENAWQYSKVYQKHVNPLTGNPTTDWWHWAIKGWNNPRAVRYPMGKGTNPLYHYWEGRH